MVRLSLHKQNNKDYKIFLSFIFPIHTSSIWREFCFCKRLQKSANKKLEWCQLFGKKTELSLYVRLVFVLTSRQQVQMRSKIPSYNTRFSTISCSDFTVLLYIQLEVHPQKIQIAQINLNFFVSIRFSTYNSAREKACYYHHRQYWKSLLITCVPKGSGTLDPNPRTLNPLANYKLVR